MDRTDRVNRPDRADRVADQGRDSDELRKARQIESRERIAQARQQRAKTKLNAAEVRERKAARAEARERIVAQRQRELNRQMERNRDRVQAFRNERQNRIATVQNRRQTLRTATVQNRTEILRSNTYIESRREIRNYWHDRGDDIRYRVADRHDHLFDDDWWEDRSWRHRPIYVSNPWWWWQPARWGSVNVFLDAGWSEPIAYDYGTDVIYDDHAVYVHGEVVGTPVEYSRRVIELANPVEVVAEAPVVETEWTPLGVWALVQENQGEDAVMFFQLSVDKAGLISGAYTNVMSGEVLPVAGQIDRSTQRAAWHIGKQKERVYEAGMANLTESEASVLVHTAPGEMQPWLLVRMESPSLPNQPAALSASEGAPPATVVNQ